MQSFASVLRHLTCLLFTALVAFSAPSLMENLGRGVVAIRSSATDVFISWRFLGTDSPATGFNLYRSTGGGAAVKLNGSLIADRTNFTDATADLTQTNAYYVCPEVGGVEQAASTTFTLPANVAQQQYLNVPLQVPAPGVTPVGGAYTYSANDCSVADLDGDGEYEIVVKWDPSNAQDNSLSGYTGNVYLDAYKLDGTRLWRIDLGRNIRAGAHYTQFMVYDFDGDGRAELVCKTAPNTADGTGAFIGQAGKFAGTPSAPIDHNADYRNSGGYILTGPEFFTIFDGLTGGELATANYVVPRNNNPASSDVNGWGDDYGNRVDRFLACVAYLDGQRPSIVLCRGYYTRAVLAAWDWRGGQLTPRWVFDTGHTGTANPLSAWRGQGAHSLTVGDVDGDGRDEITFGAAAIDDDGTGLYSTQLGHGDALHMSDMDPARPGLEVWMVHEEPGSYGANGLEFRDARTGALIFGLSGQSADIGRGAAGDIDPRHLGYEMWGSRGSVSTVTGAPITGSKPPQNFMCWWDGDLLRETLDNVTIGKWNWLTSSTSPLLSPSGVLSNNSTKATPNLSADIFGDWREEVVWRTTDSTALRIYTTQNPTSYRIPTLMHDRMYRVAIAWQNVAYNQPPHPSFYLGTGMTYPIAQPDIVTSLGGIGSITPAAISIKRYDPFSSGTTNASVIFRVTFNTPVSGVDATDFTVVNTGSATGTVSSVSAVSAVGYNVTVSSITGAGTIRLDLNASGTGIAAVGGGAAISGGFTAGQTYTRVSTLAWIRQTTGGLWSGANNWDGGVIADGTGAVPIFGNFDLLASNTVTLDSPRTLGGITLGDTQTSSAASWIVTDAGTPANVLTLDVAAGNPIVLVNALGTGATAKLDVPLAGNDGLVKDGPGTLIVSKPATLTGVLNVIAGNLRIDTGGSLAPGNTTVNVTTTNNSTLQINGGSFATGGLVTLGSGNGGSSRNGILHVSDGTATFTGGIRTNNDAGSAVRVSGGTFNANSVDIRRNAGTSPDYATGFVVTGGTSTVGTIGAGTNNSYGSLSVEGGTLTASGAVTVANQSTSGRGGAIRVIGGRFTSTEATNGIVLSRLNGTNANNVALLTVTGGVITAEKITLGFDANVNAGSGTLRVNGGTLFLGSGGIVKNGTAAMTTLVELSSGTVGAKANWSTSHPVSLPSGVNVSLRAADESGVARNITLNGALGGTGGFLKTGAGTLTLSAANTFANGIEVNAGTLAVTGSVTGAGPVNVNTGSTLTGTGTIARSVNVKADARISPGIGGAGTLALNSLILQPGSRVLFDLGPTSDLLAVSGLLTRGAPAGSGPYTFEFNPTAPLTVGSSHTLATFGTLAFAPTDFSASFPAGQAGAFSVDGNALKLTITSDGAGLAAFNAWIAPFGLPPGQNGPQDDPDGDGHSNLLESILDSNPAQAGSDGIVVLTVSADGQTYPALQYPRRQNRGDAAVNARAFANLDFTSDLGVVEVSAAPQGDGTDLVVARSIVPLSQQSVQFLRLFANLP